MSKPDRRDKFSYTSPDQIVIGEANRERALTMRRVLETIRRENLDAAKLEALITENLDSLRS